MSGLFSRITRPERTRFRVSAVPLVGRATRYLALAGVLLAWGLPGRATASEVTWHGPVSCQEREQLVFQVERALGAPLSETGRVHIQVLVERAVPDAKARLAITGETGAVSSERRLAAADCSELVEILAVAITLAVEAASPANAAAARAPASDEPADVAAHDPATVDRKRSSSELAVPSLTRGPAPRVAALFVGDAGSLPRPALGLGLGAQLVWPHLTLELLGVLWLDQYTRLEPSSVPGAGADMSWVTGGVSACTTALGATTDPLSVGLCAGWEFGRLSGSGQGISQPRQASALWLAPTLQVGLTWRPRAARLGLGARLGAAAPLLRNEFELSELGTLHRPSRMVARAAVSIDVAFE
jgi:hypothetical protein